jgi:hypothetical protein
MGSRPNRRGIRVFISSMMRPTALWILGLHEGEVAMCCKWAQIGDRALIDAIGTGDDATLRGLPKYLGEAHDRQCAGGDDVGEHLPGSDRRKPVDVANTQKRGLVRYRLHQGLHQHDIDHGGLIENRSQSSGLSSPRLKPSVYDRRQAPVNCPTTARVS